MIAGVGETDQVRVLFVCGKGLGVEGLVGMEGVILSPPALPGAGPRRYRRRRLCLGRLPQGGVGAGGRYCCLSR